MADRIPTLVPIDIDLERIAERATPPGSDAATALGCTCPVMDNGRGAGAYGVPGQYWITDGCPLHGREWATEPETERP